MLREARLTLNPASSSAALIRASSPSTRFMTPLCLWSSADVPPWLQMCWAMSVNHCT